MGLGSGAPRNCVWSAKVVLGLGSGAPLCRSLLLLGAVRVHSKKSFFFDFLKIRSTGGAVHASIFYIHHQFPLCILSYYTLWLW